VPAIIDGHVSPGMSMDQAKEAVDRVVEVRKKRGKGTDRVGGGRPEPG